MFRTLALTVGFALISTSALAEAQCDQRDSVLKLLSKKYQEAPVALGVTHNGGLVEVLSTGEGETWSIIVTTPEGLSCLVAAGEGWRSKDYVTLDPEA